MTTIDFNALTKMAQDAGFDTTELAAGTYTAEVKSANYTEKNGKGQFGFRFVVVGGPLAGQGVWKNLYVPTAASKPTAASIFLRDMGALGIDQGLAATNPDAAAKALIGRQYEITVKRDRPKSGSPGEFWTDVNVKKAPASAAPAAPVQQSIPDMSGTAAATPAWQGTARPV